MGANRFPGIPEVNDLDFRAPDLHERSLEIHHAFGGPRKVALMALREQLTPEQMEHVYALMDATQERGRIEGIQLAASQFKKHERAEEHGLRALRDQITRLEAKLVKARATNTELGIRLTGLKKRAEAAPVVEAPAEQPAPAWDYKPVLAQKPNRSEVVTDVPEQVRRVADRVEHYIRRHPRGIAQKPDVSSAFPSDRPYLAAAYRHLHASRRVRVNGWSLEAL